MLIDLSTCKHEKELKRSSKQAQLLASCARLLEYPGEDYFEILVECSTELKKGFPHLSASFVRFEEAVSKLPLESMEELYTRTFDLAPLCIPYISSHLYGDENFERGALMSRLAQRYEESQFELKAEMPDHIAVILRFMPYFEGEELSELLSFCFLVSLEKMIESLKDTGNPYYHLLVSINELIQSEKESLVS